MDLRPYQETLISETRAAFRSGARSVLLSLATGGGKTYTAAHIVEGSANKQNLCWWLCHRRELADQASDTFYGMNIPHGLVRAGYAQDDAAAVQIASIPTIVRRLDQMQDPDLLIFDECHHIGAASWSKIFHRYPDAKIIGLTATPWRLDGKGLGNWFDTMVSGPSVADLIGMGSLSPYRLFAPTMPELDGVKTQAGDYQRSALAEAMSKPTIVGDAITHYRSLCPGKRAVVFAVGVEHSQRIAAEFCAAGIPAEHVDGSMQTEERDAAVARFRKGETLVLSNADLFGEGFDVPSIEAAILLRPTKSLSLYLQQVGRALRPLPGKTEAIILDHAGNSNRHGLPDDEREWSLEDREKRRRGEAGEVSVRQCTECYFVFRPQPVCPQCGHVAPVISREIETVEGTLQEVKRAAAKAKRIEQGRAETLEDLIRIGQERGYKSGWARRIWASRQNKAAA